MNRDTLYQHQKINEDFRFTEQVAEVFDDMLGRSVPCYRQVIDMTAELLDRLLAAGDHVYDLGCSTGITLLELSRRLDRRGLLFTGIDNSAAMLVKAVRKAEAYSSGSRISFLEADITGITLENAGAILLNYTLQFIRPPLRQEFLRNVHSFLRPGGVLIMSEKILSPHAALNRTFIDIHHAFKRQQGYSELEIANKREALENVLVPFSIEENRDLLVNAGFATVETFSQWFNFVSFVAVKR